MKRGLKETIDMSILNCIAKTDSMKRGLKVPYHKHLSGLKVYSR